MDVVIGSGPAGISCAQALVDGGRDVLILDAGKTLEPDRQQARDAVASFDREALLQSDLSLIASRLPKAKNAIKLTYGSDFPYQGFTASTPVLPADASLRGSYAMGGLSNVWGSAMLPYRRKDIADWPVDEDKFNTAYRAILSHVPLAAEVDSLAEEFPLYTDDCVSLPRSRQAQILLERLEKHRSTLNASGVLCGRARLAVDAAGRRDGTPCIACGRCLHGCPRELIHASHNRLAALERQGVRYQPGYIVKSLEDNQGRPSIKALRTNGTPESIEADRVFLAAGPLHSTEILLRSLRLYGQSVKLLDSQYYLFPLLQARGARRVSQESLHTLAQIFIEIEDPQVNENTVHLQVYSFNDFLAELLGDKLGRLARVFPTQAVLGRLLLVQGYLHSNDSGRIAVTLRKGNNGDQLFLEPVVNSTTRDKVRGVLRKIRSLAWMTQAFPVEAMLDVTDPGRGFHSGGSFPMRASPGPYDTDRLGRLRNFNRVHVVDSTVFPTVPATTITLTVMANAYRIGAEAASLEKDEL